MHRTTTCMIGTARQCGKEKLRYTHGDTGERRVREKACAKRQAAWCNEAISEEEDGTERENESMGKT